MIPRKIPRNPFLLVFQAPDMPCPPPPGAPQSTACAVGGRVLSLAPGAKPGTKVWRFVPVNEADDSYTILPERPDRSLGCALLGGKAIPDARVIISVQPDPWIIQAEEVDGGYLATIKAPSTLPGLEAVLAAKDAELSLEFIPAESDRIRPKWFLRPLY